MPVVKVTGTEWSEEAGRELLARLRSDDVPDATRQGDPAAPASGVEDRVGKHLKRAPEERPSEPEFAGGQDERPAAMSPQPAVTAGAAGREVPAAAADVPPAGPPVVADAPAAGPGLPPRADFSPVAEAEPAEPAGPRPGDLGYLKPGDLGAFLDSGDPPRDKPSPPALVPRVRVKALMEDERGEHAAILEIEGAGTIVCHASDVISLHEIAPGQTLEIRRITRKSVVFGLNGQRKEYLVQ